MRSWGLTPDFLCSLVAPAHLMRLSLMKAAYDGPVQCSVQEIRDAPSFSAQVRFGEPGAPVLFLRVWLLGWGLGETEQVGEDAVGSGDTFGQLAVESIGNIDVGAPAVTCVK